MLTPAGFNPAGVMHFEIVNGHDCIPQQRVVI
jgi:hypothetical protein